MCEMITLVVPTDDEDGLRAVMERHNRAATPVCNPSVSAVLGTNEQQFLTMRHSCDCGTVLGRQSLNANVEDSLGAEAALLRHKGWSEAKIGRAITDRRKAAQKRAAQPGQDSFEFWSALVMDLLVTLKLPHAGLLVHSYHGNADDEQFEVRRRAADESVPFHETLSSMQPNEVLVLSCR